MNTMTNKMRIADMQFPGQPAIWFFVLFESFLFTAYFSVYMIYRTWHPEEFLQLQSQLSIGIGVTNTLILLVSSWSMAKCVQAAREQRYSAAKANVILTIFFAVAFLVIKVYEWSVEIASGYTFTSHEFFSFYYFLTGIHFIHLLIGFVFLGIATYQITHPTKQSQELIETSATYWHMVDYLWVMIFALLYVMR